MIPFIIAAAATVLSGTPATSVTAAHYYAFQPGVSGAGKALTFSITNKPSWAQFNTGTGRLSGTPLPQTNVGTYSNILISASDGTARAYLAPFSITVAALPRTPPRISGSPAATPRRCASCWRDGSRHGRRFAFRYSPRRAGAGL